MDANRTNMPKNKKKADGPPQVKARVVRTLLHPQQPPKPVSHVNWTRLGAEVQLDFGFVDLHEVNALITAQKEAEKTGIKNENRVEVKTYVTDRFIASPTTIVAIFTELEKLVNDLRKEGLIPSSGDTKDK